jgi:hypothetical protein
MLADNDLHITLRFQRNCLDDHARQGSAALDPDTLHCCLQCVLKRAPALMVIAHP